LFLQKTLALDLLRLMRYLLVLLVQGGAAMITARMEREREREPMIKLK